MVDVFLSYSSQDLVRARRIEGALSAAGYEVFWDQTTPPGADWDTWIREKLSTARTVVVLWSKASIASANVRHEAIIARNADKLIPVLIDELSPADFPMGLYVVQAVKLDRWGGNASDTAFRRLMAAVAAHTEKSGAPKSRPSNPAKLVLLGSLLAVGVALILSLTLLPSSRDQECRAFQEPDPLHPPDAVVSVRYSRALDTCLEFVAARASNQFTIYDINNNFIRDEWYASLVDGTPSEVTGKRPVFHCDRYGAECALEDQVRARDGQLFTVPYGEYLDNCEGGPARAVATPSAPYDSARCEALFEDARPRYLGAGHQN
jgi:hypothetical protein